MTNTVDLSDDDEEIPSLAKLLAGARRRKVVSVTGPDVGTTSEIRGSGNGKGELF